MRKQILYPVLALVLGGLGAALRMWQRLNAYDASGLPVTGALPSVVLAAFLVLCAALFLWLAFRMPKTLEDQSHTAPGGDPLALLLMAAGALALVGGALHLFGVAGSYQELDALFYASADERSEALRTFFLSNFLIVVLVVASVPTAVALLYQGKRAKSGGEGNTFVTLMPPLFVWIWLIESYRQHTANPILWDYVLFLMAVVCLLISGYFRAGFAFGVGKPRRAVFVSLLSLFFAAASLRDCGGLAPGVTLLAMTLYTLAETVALLGALDYQPRRLAEDTASARPDGES